MLELIDAFTNDLIRDPVLAADGHVYDRSSLLKYFAARKSEGRLIVSPQDPEQPMREELGEAPADVVAALAQLRADGELLKARQARSVTFKSLEALKVVFDVLDPLSELLAATLEGWKTPVVIVFGQETSGKSSLLERLAMMPLLPRGEDTCTRLPILLKLRHTKEAQLPVLVVRDSATGKEEVRRTVSLAGGQVDVRHEMERVLAAEQGGLTSVSTTRTIEVHVHSPAVPSIDLVDLPGLRLSAGSDAADMPEKAKALVKAQVEQHKGSAIFLVSCTASTPPSQSLGLQLVEELGLQRDTIGVVTMCDNIGKLDMKKLPDRLRQTSGDAFQLAPHGFIGTMTEPIKGEGLSNVQRLEMMATAERKWFASQPLLSPLLSDGLLTCDALVDKLSSVYARYLRSTWAPQTLIRLNGELMRLQAKSDALGLPEAVEAPTGPALDELRAAACRAAEAVLDEAMGGVADECFDSIIKPTVSKLAKNGRGTGLVAMHLAMVKSAMESHLRFVSQAKQAFAADASTFRLQRFPAFTEAIVAKLQTQASHVRGTFVWREQSTAELVLEAANEVTDWREACAAERIVIREQMLQVEPVKAKTLELLEIASESALTTEAVERAVAEKDPAALVALLQACAIGARTPMASGIASLADAPPAQSTDPMRVALAAAGALPPLVAMLGDGTAEERAAAAEALGKLARNEANKAAMAAAGAVEALVALVRDGDAQGKANAAGALWTMAAGDVAIKAAMAAAGYSLRDAREAGFTCKDAREAGFTCKDAKEAGFTCKDAKEAGFTCWDAKAAGFTCKDAKAAGFTCKDAREAGMLSTCKDARDAGFTALKEAGFTCMDARWAGFKAGKECYEAGFTYEEGRAAGFPSRVNFNGKLPNAPDITFYDVRPVHWPSCKSPSKNSNPGCPLPPRPPPPGEHRRGGHTVPPRVRPAHSKSFVLTTLPSPVCADNFDWDGKYLRD